MVFLGIYLGLSMGKVRQQKFLKFLIIADQMLSFLMCVPCKERGRDRILFEMKVSCKRKFAVGEWCLMV